MPKKQKIQHLSQRKHILKRPNMYIGGVDLKDVEGYFLDDDGKITYQTVEYVPGLLKIIDEILDNSLDEAIRTKFAFATKIDVMVDPKTQIITVEDNGRGIPVEEVTKEDGGTVIAPFLCWGTARSGGNFEDDDTREGLGLNGVGAFATNCYSTEFKGETCDGSKKFTCEFSDNADETTYKEKIVGGRKKYTKVTFKPDFERFGVDPEAFFSTGSVYMRLIRQRLMNLNICFPKITFTLNGEKLKAQTPKAFLKNFGDDFEVVAGDGYLIGLFPNELDDFKHYSYVNGLNMMSGGTHIDYASDYIFRNVRDLVKKKKEFKQIKPADIKNKTMLVFFAWGFTNAKFDSQTKDELTNAAKDVGAFLKDVDWAAFAKQVHKNKAIIDPIVEIFKIKEEFKKRRELNDTLKNKNIRDEKYLKSTSALSYLCLCEGDSAGDGLAASFGRDGIGYYKLRGVPVNGYDAKILKILGNRELKAIIHVLNIDISRGKAPDAPEWYDVQLPDGRSVVANGNDDVLYHGAWLDVPSITASGGSVDEIDMDPDTQKVYKKQQNIRRKPEVTDMTYENVVFATDMDPDGAHISGLLLGFFCKYAPGIVKAGRVKLLRTPLIVLKDGKKKIKQMFFNFDGYREYIDANPDCRLHVEYKKGLGSWKKPDLDYLIDKHGFEFFVETLEYDAEAGKMVDHWLRDKMVDERKGYLEGRSFDIFKA